MKLTWDTISLSLHQADIVPEGWITIKGFAELRKMSESQARRHISALRERGIVEQRKFAVSLGDKTCPVMHYRIKDNA